MPSIFSAVSHLSNSRRRVATVSALDLGPDASGIALEARNAAQSPIDTLDANNATRTSFFRRSAPVGAAPRARSALIAERGVRSLAETVRPNVSYSRQALLEVQAHFIAAHSIDPHSLEPITGLIQTAEAQIARAPRFSPCNRARVQEDIACALTALVQFLVAAGNAETVTALGQSHPLLLAELTGKARLIVLDRLMPVLEMLLTATAYETSGSVRLMVLHTLAQLVAHQAWAAVPSLRIVEVWASHLGEASLQEVAAGCAAIRHTVLTQLGAAKQARIASRAMASASVDYPDKHALCVSLLPVSERHLAAR